MEGGWEGGWEGGRKEEMEGGGRRKSSKEGKGELKEREVEGSGKELWKMKEGEVDK